MRVHIHPCQKPNVGDDLNAWYWKELMGAVIDTRSQDLFVGIGTVLNDMLPDGATVHVFGSGVGYGESKIRPNSTWKIYCLRGPLTARALGVDTALAITDPGALISVLRPLKRQSTHQVSFMPHIGIDSEEYKEIVEDIGWNYISPSDEQSSIFEAIASSDTLVTSAMHGAIIADSYRTPWLPVRTSNEILEFKWRDWFSSMQLEFTPLPALPAYWCGGKNSIKNKLSKSLKASIIKYRLRQLHKKGQFRLSDTSIFEDRKEQLLDCVATTRQRLEHLGDYDNPE